MKYFLRIMGRMNQALTCIYSILSDLSKTRKRIIIKKTASLVKFLLKSDILYLFNYISK